MRSALGSLGVVLCFVSWHPAEAQHSTLRSANAKKHDITQVSNKHSVGMAAQLVNTFENVCLETLPLLVGAVERLKKLGFELTPAGDDGMYELWSEKLDLGGHLHLAKGERKPSCGFLTEKVTRQEVGPLVDAVLAKWLGTPPVRWETGDPHAIGWQVPAGGNTLKISVATSLSDDPTKGASVTLEEMDR